MAEFPMSRFPVCLALVALAWAESLPALDASDDGRIDAPGLHNVFRLTDRLFSGSSPDGEEGFRSLARLGIKTIISVDGARPDVALARKYGLQYVHLPVGYDGIPREQALRITRAVRDLPEPVYIHCHHGQHRGPAAAAVARLFLDDRCPVEVAQAILRRAGTDPAYQGLYAAPKQLQRPSPGELNRVPADFPEVTRVGALAEIMVTVDQRWDNLKQARAAGWKSPPGHPDVDPAHECLLLTEQFREAARLPEVRRRPDSFQRCLSDAEEAAASLGRILRQGPGGAETPAIKIAFQRAAKTCVNCHAQFRDAPKSH
jgi:protein tyrosine phosphatase (PTP) superfamily phosphohydrolase (DUF442 family)